MLNLTRGNPSRECGRENAGILRRKFAARIRAYHPAIKIQSVHKDLSRFQVCIWRVSYKNGREIFTLFDSVTRVSSARVSKDTSMYAPLIAHATEDMRKLCEKYEHVKFHVWGRAMSESDAYVWEIVSTWSARKSIIDARTRREKLSLIEYGIDSKDTRRCVPRISGLFQPVYRAISLFTLYKQIFLHMKGNYKSVYMG